MSTKTENVVLYGFLTQSFFGHFLGVSFSTATRFITNYWPK
jgi:hypothetical protein